MLRISERELYRLASRGLPHYRVGRQLRFNVTEVLESLRQTTTGGEARLR